MDLSTKLYLILIFITIIFFSALSMWRFRDFERKMAKQDIVSNFKMPEIPPELIEIDFGGFDIDDLGLEGINLEKFGITKTPIAPPLSPEEFKENYKIFTSPSKAIKVKYPNSWVSLDWLSLGTEAANKKIPLFEKKEVIFFAYKNNSAFMISSFPAEISKEEIIEITKNLARESEGITIEVIEIKDEGKDAFFELKFKKNSQNFISKGKIIFTKEKSYLISFTFLDKAKNEIIPHIIFVFDNVQQLY